MKQRHLALLLLCGLLMVIHPAMAWSAREINPEIKDIIVTTSDVDLLLFATVKNGFTQEMIKDVQAGMPIVFTYKLELLKTSPHWLDKSLVETAVTHTLTYDATSKKYQVRFSNQPKLVETTSDLDEAKRLMTELNGVKVIALSRLIPDAPYAIQFKVVLKKGSLPLGMQKVLPFSSLWNFETDWRTIEFRY
ncbi:DUF4390 domain-containing protein [Desulfobulbus rhabdoformis]|jgi:hypothetical protein|uniref:DUF4390 domain-containing protein n=1 Tax=Desulfobulbus rhabdoformis TaxID=34032 RepID=UPI001965E03B|nr:DUF4390 domain-containing protein [Desulfobulbus rhabdoformis]MBM9616201.1 DUF4390 domain-containing protein [Desulfobulbus rhabdoformis]